MSATSPSYYIPPEPGSWAAPMLALLMHLALFAFFFIGIDWHSETPIAVEAEVWDIKVREAAPKPEPQPEPQPEPPPEPVKAKPVPVPPPVEKKVEQIVPPKVDIALEKEKERKKQLAKEKEELQEKLALEKKKADEKKQVEEDKKKLLAEKKRKEAAELAANEKRRAEDLKRITGSAAPTATGDAARSTGPRGDPSYAAAIKAKIKSNIIFPGGLDDQGNPQAEFKITLSPSGDVWNVKKMKSSGVAAYDAAVENAINKSSPLPRKKDGSVDREITATFKLKDLQE